MRAPLAPLACLFLLLHSAGELRSQERPDTAAAPEAVRAPSHLRELPAGSRLRVTAPSVARQPLVGDLVGVRSDTLLLRPRDTHSIRAPDPLRIPARRITDVEVAADRQLGAGALRGATGGLAVGAVFGLVLAVSEALSPSRGQDQFLVLSPAEIFVAGTVVVGVPAAVIGALAGMTSASGRWVRVAWD